MLFNMENVQLEFVSLSELKWNWPEPRYQRYITKEILLFHPWYPQGWSESHQDLSVVPPPSHSRRTVPSSALPLAQNILPDTGENNKVLQYNLRANGRYPFPHSWAFTAVVLLLYYLFCLSSGFICWVSPLQFRASSLLFFLFLPVRPQGLSLRARATYYFSPVKALVPPVPKLLKSLFSAREEKRDLSPVPQQVN